MIQDNKKKNTLIIGLIVIFAIILIRLFNIQIIDKEYKINAGNNALKYVTRYPARGLILDRNNEVLVGNKIIYDITVTPVEVQPFDTVAFCKIFDIDTSFVKEKFREYKKYRSRVGYQTLTFLKHISNEQYNQFIEKSADFVGFSGVPRTARSYPFNAGANLIGYVSEVDGDYIKKNPGYRGGDYAGKTGIEETYEEYLRGEKGHSIFLRDSRNRIVSHYENGEYDVSPVEGKNIVSTIDGRLQQYGEALMKNKVGSLVAIEPSTGEILTLVSSPGIDVSILAEISKHYNEIASDPYKPMYNRAVMSPQPPGSVFKIVNGLIGLQEGVLTPSTHYSCSQGYKAGNVKLGCHVHKSPLDFYESIMMSCNAYYCYVLRDILDNPKYENIGEAMDKWNEYVKSFGFGTKLGSDFPSEQSGFIPNSNYYNKIYGKKGWRSLTVISLSIGQGEIGSTPLHLANFAATMANRGYYYTPHIVKESENVEIDPKYKIKNYTMVDTTYFEEAVIGMYRAVNSPPGTGGTATIAAVEGLDICGKTGTAQNPHGDDHSVFICFAPKDNPKIAVAAYVENGGFGATWAAPIASLLVEQYLNGEISPERKYIEDRILSSSLMHKVKVKKRR